MGMTPQEKGREYERELAARLGAKEVPGSGATPFRKLDVEGSSFLVSAKHTDHDSFRLTRSDLREARTAVSGAGGVGGDFHPLMVLRVGGVDGSEVVVMELDTFIGMMKGEFQFGKDTSKGEARRERSRTPALFRDDDELGQ